MNSQTTIMLNTGRTMPVLGLGTWQLSDAPAAVEGALRAGYRMIDTSGDYGTQPGIREGLRRSGVSRPYVYIVTKIEETDDAYKATQKNLAELGIDYADLMLIHRPPKDDPGEDLWQGLIRARDDGLTRDIGVSNYSIGLIRALAEASGEMPAVNQIEWSPFGYSEEMFVFCEDNGVVIQAYSPLTRGKRLDDPRLNECAVKYGKSSAQIMIRWNLQMDTVPLPKASQQQHIQENIAVFDFELSDDDMSLLNNLNEHYSSLGRSLLYM